MFDMFYYTTLLSIMKCLCVYHIMSYICFNINNVQVNKWGFLKKTAMLRWSGEYSWGDAPYNGLYGEALGPKGVPFSGFRYIKE